MEVSPHRIPTLIVAVLTLVLAVWILTLRPDRRVHRGLALFLGVKGVLYLAVAFHQHFMDNWGRMVPYMWIALPFAAAYFLVTFWDEVKPGRRRRWGVETALLVGLILTESMWIYNHAWFWDGYLGLLQEFSYVVFATVALVLGWALLRESPQNRNRALLPLAVGFALEPLFFPTFLAVGDLLDGTPTLMHKLSLAILLLAIGIVCTLIAAFHITAARHRDNMLRVDATQLTILAAMVMVTGVWVHVAWTPLRMTTMDAVWHIVLVMFVSYGIIRYEIFGLDLRLKWTVNYGTVASAFAVAYFVAAELLESIFNVDGKYLGIAGAAVIALGIQPIQAMAKRFAEDSFPGVEDSDEYRQRRGREIYSAAIRRTMADGIVTPRESEAIRRLGQGLGLTAKDMTELEKRVAGAALR